MKEIIDQIKETYLFLRSAENSLAVLKDPAAALEYLERAGERIEQVSRYLRKYLLAGANKFSCKCK